MGQLSFREVPPEDICPKCRARAESGNFKVMGDDGKIITIPGHMWSRNTSRDRKFHVTFHVMLNTGTLALCLCKLDHHLWGGEEGGWEREIGDNPAQPKLPWEVLIYDKDTQSEMVIETWAVSEAQAVNNGWARLAKSETALPPPVFKAKNRDRYTVVARRSEG